MFGTVALLATFGDLRVMRSWRTQGGFRIKRHLWRVCFALFIAAASFFLGPPQRLPAFLWHSSLRPVPVLVVLIVMFFWLARVSLRQRGLPQAWFQPIRRTA
jgi:ABC-type amino acid transport system permease subunit